MASSTVDWMPTLGRHQINIGPNLGRAIKARKLKGSPPATTKRSKIQERDFYAFRYNFKPGSIDSSRPASIEVKKGPENTQITADFPSKELSEVCTYNGAEIPAKDVECVLIYDEETGQYTLERLDSIVSLQFIGKKPATTPPPPTVPSTSSTPSGNAKGKERRDDRGELGHQSHQQQEEEEGEDIEIPLSKQLSAQVAASKVPSRKTIPNLKEPNTHTLPLPSSSSKSSSLAIPSKSDKPPLASSPTLSKAAPKPVSNKTKRPRPAPTPSLPVSTNTTSKQDEGITEMERPPKRQRLSTTIAPKQPLVAEAPKPEPPVQLSLPGGPSTFVALPPPTRTIPTKKPSNTPIPIAVTVPPGVSAKIIMEEVLGDEIEPIVIEDDEEEEEEEEEDEDWEAVPTSAVPLQAAPSENEYDKLEDEIFGDGFGEDDGDGDEDEQEIDVNAFEAEMNEQIMEMDGEDGEDDDEDEEMEDAMEDPASAGTHRHISLNKLAGGIDGESDEDFSSSESDTSE